MHDKLVTTLIVNPARGKLESAFVQSVWTALEQAGGKVTGWGWLHEGEAVDIFHQGLAQEAAGEIITHIIGDVQVDAITQPSLDRRKLMLISDMDSTVITIECIDEIADMAGVKPQVAAITERAMNGELDFVAALKERVALLKGLPESILEKVYAERVAFIPGAEALVATMRANGAYCLLVSGGFTPFTRRVREALGFNADSANELIIENGALTGEVREPILDRHAKLQSLVEACAERGLSTAEVLAIGDGANDLPMLLAAGLGVAVHAKPSVQAAAQHVVRYADLTALLYAQGYTKAEFA